MIKMQPLLLGVMLIFTLSAHSKELSIEQKKELTVFFGRSMGLQTNVNDIKDVPSEDDLNQLIQSGINLNSFLCAKITDIKPQTSSKKYVITCITFENGSEQKRYVVDALNGAVNEN